MTDLTTVAVCRRCGHGYAWQSSAYPSPESVRRLGAEIREHYEVAHPGIEVNQ